MSAELNRAKNRMFIESEAHPMPLSKWMVALIAASIVVVTVAVYWQVGGHEFLNYDDPMYVWANEYVKDGLSWEGVGWAFNIKGNNANYWHPLAWISHMVDCQLFGTDSGGHHLMNLLRNS